MTPSHRPPNAEPGRRAAWLFVALCASGAALGWEATGALAQAIDGSPAPGPACRCLDGRDAGRVSARLRVAWTKAFDGERPDDIDLGAYQDATEILNCLSANAEAAP